MKWWVDLSSEEWYNFIDWFPFFVSQVNRAIRDVNSGRQRLISHLPGVACVTVPKPMEDLAPGDSSCLKVTVTNYSSTELLHINIRKLREDLPQVTNASPHSHPQVTNASPRSCLRPVGQSTVPVEEVSYHLLVPKCAQQPGGGRFLYQTRTTSLSGFQSQLNPPMPMSSRFTQSPIILAFSGALSSVFLCYNACLRMSASLSIYILTVLQFST